MKAIERIKNLQIYKNITKALKVRAIALAFTITAGAATLAGCTQPNNPGKEPTGIETITPTDTINPEVTNTPTVTVTPTPMPVHKTLQEVKDELANVKVSVDELMNEDVVYPTYFGAIEDNITTEIAKRTAYLESKGISFKRARLLVIGLNYDLLTSDAVDREKADKCLEVLYENNARYGSTEMLNAVTLVIEHNAKNPDDQIVLGWGIIDNTDTRAIINDTQQKVVKLLASNSTFEGEFLPTEKYDVTVINKDGSSTQITGLYNDLSTAVKYMNATIQTAGVRYLYDTKHYGNGLTDRTIDRIFDNMNNSFESFEESRHVNTK